MNGIKRKEFEKDLLWLVSIARCSEARRIYNKWVGELK